MIKNPKHILVTGGAGYIGSHVVRDLCDAGYKVIVLDNLSLGLRENIDQRAIFIKGDMLNPEDIHRCFTRAIDVVFHFAAWKAAGESMVNPEKYATNNICGTLNLLNVMQKYHGKSFIFSSSAAVYGDPQYIPVDENHPLNPSNYYGYTKKVIEENLSWYSKLKAVRFAALRYFNATGYDIRGQISGKEKNPANLSPVVMETAAGLRSEMQVFGTDYPTRDGTCIRDYIHVNDLSSAHIKAMHYIVNNNRDLIVNLGTGHGYSVLEVIKTAEKVTGRKINYQLTGRREGDPAELIASSDLALRELKWQAEHSDLETIFKTMSQVYL